MPDRYTRVHALLALLTVSQILLAWYSWDMLSNGAAINTIIGAVIIFTTSTAAAAYSLYQLALPAWRMLFKRRGN